MFELVYSEQFLKHETGQHPECRERLSSIASFLGEKGLFSPKKPEKIGEKQLFLVHSPTLIDEIKQRSREKDSTADNIFNSNTFEIALLACGAGLKAAELSKKCFAFSLARPPGHHAGSNFFGGFCYFNNIAFAVKSLQQGNVSRVLILDFDLHHGNGTQDIFYSDERVFYLSLHQSPLYTFPGTGSRAENNSHVQNVVLQEGTSDQQYLRLLSESFCKAFDSFRPEMVAISAGFDIFYSEGFVGNRLAVKKHSTFLEIGRIVREKLLLENTPCFAVLEGGYNLRDLPVNLFNFLKAFE